MWFWFKKKEKVQCTGKSYRRYPDDEGDPCDREAIKFYRLFLISTNWRTEAFCKEHIGNSHYSWKRIEITREEFITYQIIES